MPRAVELSQMGNEHLQHSDPLGSHWEPVESVRRCEEFIFAPGPEEATCKLLKAGSAAAISNFLQDKLSSVQKMLKVVLNRHQSVRRKYQVFTTSKCG